MDVSNVYSLLQQTKRELVSSGDRESILGDNNSNKTLVLLWSQLGDFDNLEYAWWLERESSQLKAAKINVKAIGIGDRQSGIKFVNILVFPPTVYTSIVLPHYIDN